MMELEKDLKITDYLFDFEKMILLTDIFIWNNTNNTNNNKIKKIINNINQRIFPKLVYQDISLIPCELNENMIKQNFDEESYKIVKFKIGYAGSSSTNPLNKIYFYNMKTNSIISDNKVRDFSLLLNQKHQEHFLRVYCMNNQFIIEMKNYFENINKK